MNINIILKLIRFRQWTKNLICFAGLIFGNHFLQIDSWILSLKTFFIFSLISSSIYILNDIIDRKVDRLHPTKKTRPIAAKQISISNSLIIWFIIFSFGLIASYNLNAKLFFILITYIFNNILYNLIFKNEPIIDVFSISFGFILRLISGIIIFNDDLTAWVILCTMFLSLFIGFTKRRSEYFNLKNIDIKKDVIQRPVLKKYNDGMLSALINETSFGAIITYSIFTINSQKNPSLIITIPIVYYAINYYKASAIKKNNGEHPENILINDKTLLLCISLWLISYFIILNYNITFIK